MLYESLLLFGVVFVSGWLFDTLTESRHALKLRHARQAWLFLIIGAYFIFFWRRGGQTLAMQTWHVRLVTREGAAVGRARAAARYLLAWLWFVPGLLTLHFTGLSGGWPSFALMAAGTLAYAALTWLRPDRQYWHDAVCGTRLIVWQPPLTPSPT